MKSGAAFADVDKKDKKKKTVMPGSHVVAWPNNTGRYADTASIEKLWN